MKPLAWLVLACPVLALAQDAAPVPDEVYPPPPDESVPPPPPELFPVPPPPPPPVAHQVLTPPGGAPAQPPAPEGPHRDTWYIGFGIGSGAGWVDTGGQRSSFDDYTYPGDRGTFTFNFNVGATLTPKVLLGGELGVFGTTGTSGGYDSSIVATYLDAVVTWFPMERGLFVRGGAGFSALEQQLETADGTLKGEASGGNLLAGVGYAWWLGQSFNLVVQIDAQRAWYQKDVDSTDLLALTLGFEWY